MTSELDSLISDVLAATGADAPDLLSDDSPALSPTGGDDLYFVGLIGGKDVGKSSLVNALVGQPITTVTSHGPGTEIVVAYAHRSAAEAVERLLSRQTPGRFRVVWHDNAALSRQVLLDLPDIDSVYADHIEVTRRMLRHMLYPIWIQSIEKYADQRPQQWLARVAEGNDPANFVFAINKVDLLAVREGEPAVRELCDDFARRIARTLSLPRPPRVYAIAATAGHAFDLPALRQALSRQRRGDEVAAARQLATMQRARSLMSWLSRQQLGERAQRAGRMIDDAEDIVAERLIAPFLETAVPRLLDDSTYRAELIEPAVRRRLSRWPIIGAVNSVLGPAMTFLHRAVSGRSIDAPADVVQPALAQRVAAAFAQVSRLHPDAARLYQSRKLWEETPALSAAAELRDRLSSASDRQKQAVLARAGGRGLGILGGTWRWLLTIGAIVWFPFAQPVTQILLADGVTRSIREVARLIVGVLSSSHLLQSGAFLLLWFAVLWMLLRFHTQQRADSLIARWKTDEALDPQLSFAAQTMEWADELLAPLRSQRDRFADLAERERRLRGQVEGVRDAA